MTQYEKGSIEPGFAELLNLNLKKGFRLTITTDVAFEYHLDISYVWDQRREFEQAIKTFREKGCVVDVRCDFEQMDAAAFMCKTWPHHLLPRWAHEDPLPISSQLILDPVPWTLFSHRVEGQMAEDMLSHTEVKWIDHLKPHRGNSFFLFQLVIR